MVPQPRPGAEPERIGRYHVLGRLGSGGMGEVFLAWDDQLKRQVAIKRIRQDIDLSPEQQKRFNDEACQAAKLNHSAVVQIHDVISQDDAIVAIVMEYIEGRTLAELLAARRLETAEVLRLTLEIAQGLDHAQQENLVHRDLKAANVLVTRSGHAKIVDFGLARPVVRAPGDPGVTRQGMVMGTSFAMSPEQIRGEEVDKRSDLFSFGSLFHEMLTRRPPFQGKNPFESQWKVLNEEPVDPLLARPDLPAEAAELLLRLLEKDRDDRPNGTREVIEVLERLQTAPSAPLAVPQENSVSELPTDAETILDLPERPRRDPTPAPALVRKPSFWTRRRLLVAGVVLLLLAVAAIAYFLLVSLERRPDVQDWATFDLIRGRVEAGEARREDLASLEQIIATTPDFIDARILAARIALGLFEAQRERADLDHATRLVNEAKELFREDPRLLRMATEIALAGGDTGKAETYLEKLKGLTPDDPELLPLLAELAEEQGRLKAAEDLLIEAIEEAPAVWQNWYLYTGFLVRHGEIGKARKQVDKFLEYFPGNTWALEQSGSLALSDGDLDNAERIYKSLLNFPAHEYRALVNLGTIAELSGFSQQAAKLYRRALGLRPGHVPAMINLAEVEREIGNESRAAELYNQALQRLDAIGGGLSLSDAMAKAQCLARLNQTREALEIMRRKSDKIHGDPQLLYQSALVYSLARERALAIKAARAALEKGWPPRWFRGSTLGWLREEPELRHWFRPGA